MKELKNKYEEEYFFILTCAHNLINSISPKDDKFEIAKEIGIILGKY